MPERRVLPIVITTLFPPGNVDERWAAFEETMASWVESLHFDGDLFPILADDGSEAGVLAAAAKLVARYFGRPPASLPRTDDSRRGVGASLNRGIARAGELAPVFLYAVDDWALDRPIDLTVPYDEMVAAGGEIGAIRLGPPHANIRGTVVMGAEDWYLELARFNGGFVASQRPTLWHQSMFAGGNGWPENCSALECERIFNERYCADHSRPRSFYWLPTPWRHVPSIELSAVEP